MDGKLVKAALAGAGALALVGAGSTYAAFSGSTAVAGSVAAGTFKVAVSPVDATFSSGGGLLPGGPAATKDFRVANSGSVAASAVTVQLVDRQDAENGCASDSERAADPQCDQTGDRGDLSNQAVVQAEQYAPVSGRCDAAAWRAGPRTAFQLVAGSATGSDAYHPVGTSLAALVDSGAVAKLPFSGSTTCVRVSLQLPDVPGTENDAVQGDAATFKVKLGLVQKTSTTSGTATTSAPSGTATTSAPSGTATTSAPSGTASSTA